MADLEKVIKGLERCTGEVDCDREIHHNYCPYWNNGCFEYLIRDALSLLKSQEPRVMTLEELWHMEHKPVYLERKNSRLYITEPSIVLKTEQRYIPSLGDSYILMRENKIHDKYWACGYNITWRCWTSRPTDEQRAATPWSELKKEET